MAGDIAPSLIVRHDQQDVWEFAIGGIECMGEIRSDRRHHERRHRERQQKAQTFTQTGGTRQPFGNG